MSYLPMIRGLASHGEAYSPAAPCTLAIIPRFSDKAMCVNNPPRSHRYALFEHYDSTVQIAETKIMTEYMKAGNELPEEQPNPLDKTPFSDIEELRFTDGEDLRTVIEQAQKIHRTAKRNDSISNDDSVIESLALPNENIPRESFYAYKVGPLAQTCDALQWNTVFDIDLTTAPQPDSDAFREAASELNIPDTIGLKLAPEFIRSAYRLLWEHKEETGRPIHPHRLKADANAVLKPRIYPRVFDYLSQLPSVTGPTESPAWEYVDPEQPASTEAGEEAESHV